MEPLWCQDTVPQAGKQGVTAWTMLTYRPFWPAHIGEKIPEGMQAEKDSGLLPRFFLPLWAQEPGTPHSIWGGSCQFFPGLSQLLEKGWNLCSLHLLKGQSEQLWRNLMSRCCQRKRSYKHAEVTSVIYDRRRNPAIWKKIHESSRINGLLDT